MSLALSLEQCYFGRLDRVKAEQQLVGTPDGTFMVRYSLTKELLVISISHQGTVKHVVVGKTWDFQSYIGEGKSNFPTISVGYFPLSYVRPLTAADVRSQPAGLPPIPEQ